MNRYNLRVLVILVLGASLLSGFAIVVAKAVAQPELPTNLLIQPEELPDCQWNGVRALTADYPGPLSTEEGFDRFEKGYQAEAICPGGYVVSLVYYYRDQGQVTKQFEQSLTLFRKEKVGRQGIVLQDYGLSGQAWRFTGSEGGFIYWFIRPKGRALLVLVVDAPPNNPSSQGLFETLIRRIQKR